MESSEYEYKKYLQLIIKRKELFIALALAIMTGAIIYSYLLPKKYMATSTVFIGKGVISELVKGIATTPSMEDTIKVLTYAITSRTLLAKAIDSLGMNAFGNNTANIDATINKLQRNTMVKRENDFFTISYVDENPRMARDFVNTLIKLYIAENTSTKRGESSGATQFLSEQLDTFKNKLEKAEADVNEYKRNNSGIISIDEGSVSKEIAVSQQKLYELELRRHQLEGMRRYTRKAGDPLQTRLTSLQKKLDELRIEYTDTYPEVLKVKSDIETVKEQLKARTGVEIQSLEPIELEKIESEIAAIKSSENSLQRYIATNQALLLKIPAAKTGLDQLEMAKNHQKSIYEQLYARQNQSEVSKQVELKDTTTFRIVEPARLPRMPVSPNRLKIMLCGIIGGIAGSFGVLLLLEQMDNSVKDVEFVKGLGIPLLAVIPRIHNQKEIDAQQRHTVRLFSIAGVYFLFLLCFPLMELLGITYMDNFLDTGQSAKIVQGVKDSLPK